MGHLAIFPPGGEGMEKQSEQTQGQQLLKQLKDAYRRPQRHGSLTETDEHASGSLPDPQYWPSDISHVIN
jgi:hypothetical protein